MTEMEQRRFDELLVIRRLLALDFLDRYWRCRAWKQWA